MFKIQCKKLKELAKTLFLKEALGTTEIDDQCSTHLPLFQRNQVQVPELTSWPTAIHNSSPGGSMPTSDLGC